MFTGIIETTGTISSIFTENDNLHFTLQSELTNELKIDQSVAHNGVCLTVVEIVNNSYTVTAINETLKKTNLNTLKIGDSINLERAMELGARLDGHIVQGHVDQTGECINITEENGSHIFSFTYDLSLQNNTTIEKGSITINGVSLTVINSKINEFSVAIIPYTLNNTTFNQIQIGSIVNLEFDVLGKYVAKLLKN